MTDGYGGKSLRDEDLQEEDVWAVVKGRVDSSSKVRKAKDSFGFSSAWRLPAAQRVIPRANSGSHEFEMALQSSAPVNIPDWSKVYKNSKKGLRDGSWIVDDEDGENSVDGHYHDNVDDVGNDDDDDDDDGEMVPPHEYIARKHARGRIASFSMCEGVGRTLKGRDLSILRNAILTKTGFLE